MEIRKPTVPRWHSKFSYIFFIKPRSLWYYLLKVSTTPSISTASSMNLQSNPEQPPQRILSPSSSRSRASSFRDGFSRYRWVLYFLVGMIVLIMALGLLFVAHQYYIGFGGQGWLKSRGERRKQNDIYANHLFLPLRKQEVWTAGSERRSPQNDVPYYACGDQQNSCQTYNQPVSSIHLFTICMLIWKPEYMLPTLVDVLRGILHSIGNFLL